MKYSMTLSRWHKVVERINADLKEREINVKTAFTATTISPWNKQGVVEKVADIVWRAAMDLELVKVGSNAVAHIRSALAIRNAQLGISDKLARAEAAKRRAALYRAIIEGQKPDMVLPEAVHALPDLAGDADSFSFGRRTAVTVTLQTADQLLVDEWRENLADEAGIATELLDEVADLNREKIELELPDEMRQFVGLAT